MRTLFKDLERSELSLLNKASSRRPFFLSDLNIKNSCVCISININRHAVMDTVGSGESSNKHPLCSKEESNANFGCAIKPHHGVAFAIGRDQILNFESRFVHGNNVREVEIIDLEEITFRSSLSFIKGCFLSFLESRSFG